MSEINLIAAERERQFTLPGTETDFRKTPNDWVATITSILGEGVERGGVPPSADDFRRSLIKSAAVCVAALQHVDAMLEAKKLL